MNRFQGVVGAGHWAGFNIVAGRHTKSGQSRAPGRIGRRDKQLF
ncbi:hypothetical protein ACUHMQ_18235 [Chitinimonas sp. PSY-7]